MVLSRLNCSDTAGRKFELIVGDGVVHHLFRNGNASMKIRIYFLVKPKYRPMVNLESILYKVYRLFSFKLTQALVIIRLESYLIKYSGPAHSHLAPSVQCRFFLFQSRCIAVFSGKYLISNICIYNLVITKTFLN